MNDKEQQIYAIVFQACAENPLFVKNVIDAATQGVQEFAHNQQDNSSKMAAMLCDILDNNDKLNTKFFKKTEIFNKILPYFKGSEWAKKMEALLK